MISLLSNIYKSTQVREIGVKVCLFFETVCLRLNNKYCNQLFFFSVFESCTDICLIKTPVWLKRYFEML